VKIILGCLVVFFGMSFAVQAVKAHHGHLLSIDTHLPATVGEGTWAPVQPRRAAGPIRFESGNVVLPRCRGLVLGGYSVHINGGFTFTPSAAQPGPRCGSTRLISRFKDATRLDASEDNGHRLLTFTGGDDHTVLVLRQRAG
jgi:hypothetical protein